MEESQVSAEIAAISSAVEQKQAEETPLTLQQQTWIDYNAVGGLVSEIDGSFRMSPRNPKRKYDAQDLANDLGVSRDTLYYWSRSIPNFGERVAARRKEINSENRVTQVWNGVYMAARGGSARAADIFLTNHDPNYVSPTRTLKHEAGNSWAELLRRKADRKAVENKNQTSERKFIDATPSQSRPAANQ